MDPANIVVNIAHQTCTCIVFASLYVIGRRSLFTAALAHLGGLRGAVEQIEDTMTGDPG